VPVYTFHVYADADCAVCVRPFKRLKICLNTCIEKSRCGGLVLQRYDGTDCAECGIRSASWQDVLQRVFHGREHLCVVRGHQTAYHVHAVLVQSAGAGWRGGPGARGADITTHLSGISGSGAPSADGDQTSNGAGEGRGWKLGTRVGHRVGCVLVY